MDVGLLIASLKNGIGALSAVQSNEVLRERIAFIGEQIDVLQKAHAATIEELAEAKATCCLSSLSFARYSSRMRM